MVLLNSFPIDFIERLFILSSLATASSIAWGWMNIALVHGHAVVAGQFDNS